MRGNMRENLQRCVKSESAPDWLYEDALENWDKTDLTYSFFLKEMAKIETAKRDNIPPETLRIWFNEFIRRGVKVNQFKIMVNAVLTINTFGAVKINDFFNQEELFTRTQMNLEIDRIINRKRREAQEMKENGMTIDEATQTFIEFSANQKFINQSKIDRQERIDDLIEQRTKEITKEKRTKILNLSLAEKVKLLDKLLEDKILEAKQQHEKNIMLHNLEVYAYLIPEEYLEK